MITAAELFKLVAEMRASQAVLVRLGNHGPLYEITRARRRGKAAASRTSLCYLELRLAAKPYDFEDADSRARVDPTRQPGPLAHAPSIARAISRGEQV